MPTRTVTITNMRGLHARAAAKFVKTLEGFKAQVQVERKDAGDTPRVGGRSILGLMMLGAEPGTEILLHAEGDDADAALDQLTTLITNKFGEEC